MYLQLWKHFNLNTDQRNISFTHLGVWNGSLEMCCFYPISPSRYVRVCSCKWEQNNKALTLCVTELDEQEENLLGHGVQGSQGDLMVLGSNQKVKMPLGRANALWAVKFSPMYFCPHLPCSQGTKNRESQVISSLGTNSALGHHLHMTLIPHLSGSKTCPAFDGKHLNLFGSPKTTAPTIWTNHSRATSKLWPDHSLLHHKMNHYQLAGGPTSLRFNLV